MAKRKHSGVYERPDAPGVFYIRWTDINGKPQRKATEAKTASEAAGSAAEERAKVYRQKRGLEPVPIQRASTGITIWDLSSWWLENKCSERSRKRERYRLEADVKRTKLGEISLAQDVEHAVASYLDQLEKDGAAPGTINKLRGTLFSVFKAAKQPPRKWTGPNPIAEVPVRPVPKQKYNTLEPDEIEPMLASANDDWEGFLATGIYLGLRKGEIAGLLKECVDLGRATVLVGMSYENVGTKGGTAADPKEDLLPIPSPLLPYFQEAMKTPGPWLFPNLIADRTGMTMYTEDANPEKRLRTALKKAGIVTGYHHHCRRCGFARRPRGAGKKSLEGTPVAPKAPIPSPFPKHSEFHPDDKPRQCPQCKMRLWAEGVPRVRRFHDLRHSLITILLQRHVPHHHVQRIARHAKVETTLGIYGHLNAENLREAVEMVAPAAAPLPLSPPPVSELGEKTSTKRAQLSLVEKKAGPTGGITQ
jgi:integrase